MITPEDYQGREQTLVKHFVLRNYLARFAHIVGGHWPSITYVDCFSGPWNSVSDSLSDSSFSIALAELRKARVKHSNLKIRCFFIEKEPAAYERLKAFCESVTDVEIETANAALEPTVPQILRFVKKAYKSFPFIFIDPTGWTGFPLKTITPLLQLRPCEVLINFMTNYINRFIESKDSTVREGFESLYGSPDALPALNGLEGMDREDAMTELYAKCIRQAGDFTHSNASVVLQPQTERTHFHLIYATRNIKGVDVFKSCEKSAMALMENSRAEAHQRQQRARNGTQFLFPSDEMPRSQLYEQLRRRYLERAKTHAEMYLQQKHKCLYDEVWLEAMKAPLVWESDLREWIDEWQKAGLLSINGLTPRGKPKRETNVILNWNTG